MISLIAALASNRVIGVGNRLPWHLPEDFKYFRRVTTGHPVVMGRKTFESIGRLLPGRENRIVTRQIDYGVEGARIFRSLEDACHAKALSPAPSSASSEVFVLGGADIYGQALDFADRLYLTLIDKEFEGDARFPEWTGRGFAEVAREAHAATVERDYGFSFVVLERLAR